MSSDRGFTLVEILVVLLIVGITISFAMLSFDDFGAKRRIVFATEEFVRHVNLVQHQAILEMSTFGILVDKNSYQVYRYADSTHWSAVSKNHIFTKHFFPSQAILKFQPQINTRGTPQIVINESGDMNPFQLLVGVKDSVISMISGSHSGAMTINIKPAS